MIFFRYFAGFFLILVTLGELSAVQAEALCMNPATNTLIPRRYLFGNPEKASAQISPDGKFIAYLAPDSHNVLNVWIRDLTRIGSDRQVTADQNRGIREFSWQLDNKHILYIQDLDGDENWHLYQTDLTSQVTKDLTPFPGVKAKIQGAESRFPQTVLLQMNKRNPEDFDVYRLDLESGQLDLDTQNPGGVISWGADHDLHVRVAQSFTEDGSTLLRIRDNENSPWRDWLSIAPTDEVDLQGFTADNQSIYLMTNQNSDTNRLLKINIASGERTVVAEDSQYDLSEFFWHPTTYAPEAVSLERERNEWIILDPSLKSDFNFLSERLKTPFMIYSRDLANQNWIVVSQSDQRPSRYYLFRRELHALEFLFSTQPILEQYPLSPMKPVSFQARDGMKLHGYLTLPKGKEPRNLPSVLLVHGGPWARDSWGLQPVVQWLANRGYVVFQVNFRGSTGYGKKYLNAGNREWGNKMHTDLLDAKQWLIQQGYTNPQKVGIFGGSYGGYATLAGLAFTPEEFCCGVDIVGPSNIITLLQTFPPYWKSIKVIMDLRVGKLETETEFLKSRSPLFKASQITKPLLIAQGANDPRVKQAESDQIVAVMREKQLPVEYLLFADEGHGFVRPANRLKFYAAAEAFLAKYLGGCQETPTHQENWDHLKR